MKSIKEKIYFHSDKENNWEIVEKHDLEEKGFNTDKIAYMGYEIEMDVEIFEDGSNKVLTFQGVNISDKNISI